MVSYIHITSNKRLISILVQIIPDGKIVSGTSGTYTTWRHYVAVWDQEMIKTSGNLRIFFKLNVKSHYKSVMCVV